MLVCNVSARPRGRQIPGELAEGAAAVDAAIPGILFIGLVDDPASASEIVDAGLGSIMIEAANAADTFGVGSLYTAADLETTSANAIQDASVTSPLVAAWNPADAVNITFSNGNLTANCNNAIGGGTRCNLGKSSGKYYWEVTIDVWTANTWPGVIQSSVTLPASVITAAGTSGVPISGQIYVNSASTSSLLGGRSSGNVIGIAVDFTARLLWMRVAPVGNWNGSGTANPATGTGGLNISALSGILYPVFNGFTVGNQGTANFGATAFTGSVPSGFTSYG